VKQHRKDGALLANRNIKTNGKGPSYDALLGSRSQDNAVIKGTLDEHVGQELKTKKKETDRDKWQRESTICGGTWT